jgi:hypothetical protein
MITKNYQASVSGTLIASGEGGVTMTCNGPLDWAIGDSLTVAPTVKLRHSLTPREEMNPYLEAG